MTNRRKLRPILAVSMLLAVLMVSVPVSADGGNLGPDTLFYVAKPNHGANTQIADLISNGDKADANLIRTMIDIPQSVWFESGSPHKV